VDQSDGFRINYLRVLKRLNTPLKVSGGNRMKNDLPFYELTYIISGNLPEDQHPPVLEKVSSLLNQAQAQIVLNEDLGKKKLAYPIKNLRHGFYKTMTFYLEPAKLKAIENELKLENKILRFLIIKSYEKTAEEIASEAKAKNKRAKEKIAEKVKEVTSVKEAKLEKQKVSLEDLDKKLDELLDEDVI